VSGKKGFVYIAQNPAFMHLFKIGYTKNEKVENRGLTSSNVPEDFVYLRTYECNNIKHAKHIENVLHEQVEPHRHYSQAGRKTEFFYVNCLNRVLTLINTFEGIKDVSDTVELETETNETYDASKSIEFIKTKEVKEVPSGYDTYENLKTMLDLKKLGNKRAGLFCYRVSARHTRKGLSTVLFNEKIYYNRDVFVEQAKIENLLM